MKEWSNSQNNSIYEYRKLLELLKPTTNDDTCYCDDYNMWLDVQIQDRINGYTKPYPSLDYNMWAVMQLKNIRLSMYEAGCRLIGKAIYQESSLIANTIVDDLRSYSRNINKPPVSG